MAGANRRRVVREYTLELPCKLGRNSALWSRGRKATKVVPCSQCALGRGRFLFEKEQEHELFGRIAMAWTY